MKTPKLEKQMEMLKRRLNDAILDSCLSLRRPKPRSSAWYLSPIEAHLEFLKYRFLWTGIYWAL